MSEKELTDLIERIKERRLKLEMSYQDLSDATQISKSTLQRYETGYIKKVPINQIEILAKALHTTPSYLMGWDAPPSPSLSLTQQEETHIKKYRQLDADGREDVDDYVDMKLAKLQRKAEEGAESLG
ncbi:MAG TPA: XRE family transcriptional regulator [Phascolarctobacterium succinatutens]|uniref:helix-turn-helix domain-containing protein n=1 Tax=Phascolarctobacterium succinatutens TaxID=626940 RepID=UPI000EDED296|nr:helix-turn-helix transcriptional regulator [Phascolarctobacterium succinatutens]HAM93213.1 XRE family transcriptional regulator [Phascolarctobacterium succinatutens]